MVKEISWKIYLTTGIVTFIVFIIGLGVGLIISSQKMNILKIDLEELQIRQLDSETELAVLNFYKEKSCDTLSYELEKIMYSAGELEKKLGYYTEDEMKRPEFDTIKKQYMLTLIRYYLFWEMLKENCNKNVTTILYFYSIKDCDDCQNQGFILTYLKEKYPDKIMIFALDYNLDLYTINLLKNTYQIKKIPSLIIDGKKYEGLINLDKLKEILDLH